MSPRLSARERQAAEAAKMLARPRGQEGTPRPGVTAQRTEPIRLPVSLPPELHRDFKKWGIGAAEVANLAEVPMAAAVRALIQLLTFSDADDLDPNSSEYRGRQELSEELTARVIRKVKAER